MCGPWIPVLEYPKDLFKVQAEPLPRPNRAKSFGSRWRKPASLPSNPGSSYTFYHTHIFTRAKSTLNWNEWLLNDQELQVHMEFLLFGPRLSLLCPPQAGQNDSEDNGASKLLAEYEVFRLQLSGLSLSRWQHGDTEDDWRCWTLGSRMTLKQSRGSKPGASSRSSWIFL